MSTADSPPPEPSLRWRRREKAKFEIARAALELVKRNGYEATTVLQIADAAAYSERSFYRYFSSKEDVILFEVEQMIDHSALNRLAAGMSPWKVVRSEIFSGAARLQQGGGEFAGDVLRAWMTDPALAGPFSRVCNRWQELVAKAWATAYGTGDPDKDLNAQLVARYLLDAGLACYWVFLHTGDDLEKLLAVAFDKLEGSLSSYGLVIESDGVS